MLDYSINELPKMLEKKEITDKEFLNQIAVYIMQNRKLFGLQRYDDDFNSEVIVKLLEGNTSFMKGFQEDKEIFIPYLYSYIKSLIHDVKKMYINTNSKEDYLNSESIAQLPQKMCSYEVLSHEDKGKSYMHIKSKKEEKYDKAHKENLKHTDAEIEENSLEKKDAMLRTDVQDKMLLVLAVKSAYYLTDEEILKICKLYNLNVEDFYEAIELCKKSLEFKIEKRQSILERRNKAYYFHKKYETQLQRLKETEFLYEPEQLKFELERKNLKHLTCWKRINSKLDQGYLMIRPSSKMVADLLGICVRQVDYYLHLSKHKN